jgi:hypothetical protein
MAMTTTTTTTTRAVRTTKTRARRATTTMRATTTRRRGEEDGALARACVALAASAAMALTMTPVASAGLNKSGNNDAYAEMMRQMEEDRKRDAESAPALSAESLFKQGGGACGEGYELKVVKVLGASCVCASDSCAEDDSRKERSEYERSFGKDKSAEADAPVGDSGIKFTFATD